MKSRLPAALVLLLAGCLVCKAANKRVEGCVDPKAMAEALARLEAVDWSTMSLAKLRPIWPTELDALNCGSAACDSVWSKDRIISGHCECCTTFAFKVQTNMDGSKNEQLSEIIVNYSAVRRDDLVEIAREFASAAGLRGSDLTSVGGDADQHFHWQSNRGGRQELFAIELRFAHRGNLWELFFNYGRSTM